MQYQARAQTVEAERVTLAGQEMAAVAINGKAHLVPAEVFDVFFATVESPATAHVRREVEAMQQTIAKQAASLRKPFHAPEGKPVTRKAESTSRRDAILKWLADGPLTTAELADHTYPDQPDKTKRRDACWQLSKDMLKAGQIERVEHNGVDKWAIRNRQ
jgi:hypothetical protein